MTEDLNLHVEAIRALFKKRFSGECTNSDGLKSTDILKGKNDVDKNFDWNVCVNDLDVFNEDIEAAIVHVDMLFKQKIINFRIKNKIVWG